MPQLFSTLAASPFTGEDPYRGITALPVAPKSEIPATIAPKPAPTKTGLVSSISNTSGISSGVATKSGITSVSSNPAASIVKAQAPAPSPKPVAPTVTKTDMVQGGMLQTMSDGTQKFVPMAEAPKPAAPTPTPTISTATAKAAETATPKAPVLQTELDAAEQQKIQEETDARIQDAINQSNAAISNIQKIGQGKIASSKSALAVIGALGHTITGMPIETGLGALSQIQDGIDKSIREEQSNLQSKIAEVKSQGKVAAQTRLDHLNELSQKNWENALKFVQEDRNATEAEKKTIIDDLNIKKLQSDITNDTENKNVDTVTKQIERLAEGQVPIDKITAAQIADYETKLGLPTGSFSNYYKAKLDYAKLATEENKIKLDQAKANLEKTKNAAGKTTTKTVKVGSGKTAKTYLITYDANGKEVKRENIGGSGVVPSKTPNNNGITPKNAAISKNDQSAINRALNSAKGADGFVHPDDYAAAKADWVNRGGTPTTFDTKMRGYRNPENTNYKVGK